VKWGEKIYVGDDIVVSVKKNSANPSHHPHVVIEAPIDVDIRRETAKSKLKLDER
jgi:sRNA-binding carbon storage regulator CsrA